MSILESKYKAVRSMTSSLTANLSAEDQMVQSCPGVRPIKWHQAHTTWFFETFVLRPFLVNYKSFREDFHRLFDSYSIASGEEIPDKRLQTSFSRPLLDDVLAFRRHVDAEMGRLMSRPIDKEASWRIALGLNHEQQHQELILTDIKHAFFSNPLHPKYEKAFLATASDDLIPRLKWYSIPGGLVDIGHPMKTDHPLDFCFDIETPRHKVCLAPYRIASREVLCREYLEFMADDAYGRPELWLSDGWDLVKRTRWQAPLYWERDPSDETGWQIFTLRGWHGLSVLLDTPVCHVSYFEADAYARWRGCRLPTETEWELVGSQQQPIGNLLEAGWLHPAPATGNGIDQIFGDCWEWTASPATGYPGYRSPSDALGEYNGRFMSAQMILRGGSCVTPADHVRATYRHFCQPATRWQFSGIRLAD